MKNVVALVLAGGQMGDYGVLTQNRAKGALTIAGIYRIIDFALSNLVNSGINQIGLIIQYLPGSLIEHVGSGHPWNLDNYGKTLKIMPPFVGKAETVWYDGAADAIYRNMNFVKDQKAEHVIILSGEHLFHCDFRSVMAAHIQRDADLTVVTSQLPPEKQSCRFGYVTVNDDGKVTQYVEKPDKPVSDIASTGIYIFKSSILDELLTNNSVESHHSLAGDILPQWIPKLNSYEYRLSNTWEYMETARDYYDAQFRFKAENHFDILRKWDIMTNLKFRRVGHAPAASFGRHSSVTSSMISPGCDIQGTVKNSILSPGIHVARGAVVSNSILYHDCRIEQGAVVEHVISDRDATFGANSVIGKMETGNMTSPEDYPLTLIGKGATIGSDIVIPPGTQIRPGKLLSTQEAVNLEV